MRSTRPDARRACISTRETARPRTRLQQILQRLLPVTPPLGQRDGGELRVAPVLYRAARPRGHVELEQHRRGAPFAGIQDSRGGRELGDPCAWIVRVAQITLGQG